MAYAIWRDRTQDRTASSGGSGAALDWTVQCVAPFPKFTHPATGPASQHLARLTDRLGMAVIEDRWRRATGQGLPPAVREAVVKLMKETEGGG